MSTDAKESLSISFNLYYYTDLYTAYSLHHFSITDWKAVYHDMEAPCVVPAVTALSDSSETETEWLQKEAQRRTSKRRVRSAGLVRKRPRIDDTVNVQVMLSQNSAKCSSGCRDHFRNKASFQELLDFRAAWGQLHKLDQDTVVTCFK